MARRKKISFDTRCLPGLFDEILAKEDDGATPEPQRRPQPAGRANATPSAE